MQLCSVVTCDWPQSGSAAISHHNIYRLVAKWSCCHGCWASGLQCCSQVLQLCHIHKLSTAGLLYLYEIKSCVSQKLQFLNRFRPQGTNSFCSSVWSDCAGEQDLRGFVSQAGKLILTEARELCLSSAGLTVTSQAAVFSIKELSWAWELTTNASGKPLLLLPDW